MPGLGGAVKVQGLELDLLGGFELRWADGRRVGLSSKKASALLAYLALSMGRPVSRDKIAGLLWSDRGDEQARTSLRQTLSVLRKALPDPDGRFLVSSAAGLGIDPSLIKVDVTGFGAGIAEGRREDLERAVEAFKGPFMDGFEINSEPFEDWLRDERARLFDLAAQAIERLLQACREEGNCEAALTMARHLLRLDPLREDIHCTVMRILQEQKRWTDALKQYGQCDAVLSAELGIAPQAGTQALYQEILRQRDSVEAQRAHNPVEPSAEGREIWDQLPLDPVRREGKPLVVVLPFANLSGDSEQSFFSDGITEDIITELSRFPELFVIARNSAFSYKDRATAVREVRRELGVDYVVLGSVRKAGKRVRVTAQLVEAESGTHIWAERFDRELVDVFDLQDELTRGIVAVLPGRVENFEARKIARRPPKDMAAYELLLAGKIHHHLFNREDNGKSLDLLERAIALDPNYAAAWAWKACVLGQALGRGYQPDPKALFEGASAAVEKALALDENEVEGHRILAEISMETRRWNKAEQHNARALALNPNDPRLLAQKGELLTWDGQAEEGVAWIRMAMSLDPYSSPFWSHLLGRALMLLGNHAEAVDAYLKSSYPRFGYHADMAGCYVKLAMNEDAREQAALALKLKPDFSLSDYVTRLAYRHEPDRARHRELLEGAGLPA